MITPVMPHNGQPQSELTSSILTLPSSPCPPLPLPLTPSLPFSPSLWLRQTLGNHEFDFGPAVLGTYIKQLQFPMLGGCNVNVSSEPSLAGLVQRYIVKRVKGIKVGPATREQRVWVYLRTRKVKAGAKPCLAGTWRVRSPSSRE